MAATISSGRLVADPIPSTTAPSQSRTNTLIFAITDLDVPADYALVCGVSTGAPATLGAMTQTQTGTDANGAFTQVSINRLTESPDTWGIRASSPNLTFPSATIGDEIWAALFDVRSPVSGTVPIATRSLGLLVA